MTALVVVNVALAIGTALFGVLALVAPQAMSGQAGTSPYFARMYAARAVPFGSGLAAILVLEPGRAVAWLVVAAVIQFLDAAIGLGRGQAAAVVIPAVAGCVHAASAALL